MNNYYHSSVYLIVMVLAIPIITNAQWTSINGVADFSYPRTMLDATEVAAVRASIQQIEAYHGKDGVYTQLFNKHANAATGTASKRNDINTVAKRAYICKNAAFALLMDQDDTGNALSDDFKVDLFMKVIEYLKEIDKDGDNSLITVPLPSSMVTANVTFEISRANVLPASLIACAFEFP